MLVSPTHNYYYYVIIVMYSVIMIHDKTLVIMNGNKANTNYVYV